MFSQNKHAKNHHNYDYEEKLNSQINKYFSPHSLTDDSEGDTTEADISYQNGHGSSFT